jgi:aminopeptidase N
MKKILYISVISWFIVITACAQDVTKMEGSRACSMKKSAMKYLPASPGNIESGPLHSYDVLNYTLDLDIYHCFISPYTKGFQASNTITFKVDSTLGSIRLNAVSTSLRIDSVRLNGMSFTHSNDTLTVQLDRTYNPGEIARVKIYYHHDTVSDKGFYVRSGMVFTDCEPEGARCWYPCWDHPSDKATLDLTARVPSTVKLGSNGILMDSTNVADTAIIYHWVSTDRISTYLIVMSAKVNYNLDIVYWHKLSNPDDSIPFRFYYNAGEHPGYIESIIGPLTTYYSQNYCEHPHPKNGFATLNILFPWGGMENQTLTSLCPNCWNEDLIAHEFCHQWFGDMITCATWADVWLNEGFATWSQAFWNEHSGGWDAYKARIDGFADGYLGGNPGWAIYVPDWAIHTPQVGVLFNYSITYEKAACALHQIRYMLGDTLFFHTLQAYCADTNLRFKNATTADFNAKVNQITGQNYDWYFSAWIYQPNHPVYQNSYNIREIGPGQWKVKFVTHQTQTNAPYFPMILELNIRFADYSDTTFRVMNNTDNEHFSWIFSKQPVSLLFDPDNQIVLKKGYTYMDTLFLASTADSYGNFMVQSTSGWTIVGDMPSWLAANKINGIGTDSINFHTLVPNPNSSERSATFAVNINMLLPFAFTVTQLALTGGIAENQRGNIKIFPNPSSGIIQILSYLPFKNISVVNAGGVIIREIKANDQVINLDLSSEGQGIYFLKITGENWVANHKVILMK